MILPVVAYGHPVLKHVAEEISPDYPDFKQLVDDMFETMYYSEGVGLAAPQINKSIRLFVIDTDPFSEKYPEGKGIKKSLCKSGNHRGVRGDVDIQRGMPQSSKS